MNPRHVNICLRLVALLVVCCWSATSLANPPLALAPGDRAPELTGITFPVERPFEADWSAAKITLVNFWATWCLPCKEEMPVLQELYAKHREDGLQIIGPFELWEKDRIEGYVESVGGIDYTLIKPHSTTDYYWGGISVRPITFMINSDGYVMRKYVGASKEQVEGLRVDIAAALAGEPLPLQVPPSGSVLPEEFKKRMEDVRKSKGLRDD